MQFMFLTHHGFILLVSVLIFNYVVDHFCSLLRLSIHAMADGAPLEEEGFSFVDSEPLLPFDLPLRDNTSAVAESLGLPLGGTSMVVETYASISSVPVTQSWQLNNTALKFIRDTNETNGNPTTERVDLTMFDPYPVGVLARTKGMAYTFVENETQPWSWRQMLASFKDEIRQQILGHGDDGLVSISCEAMVGSYDHKRHHAAKVAGRPYEEGAMVPVWDFVVTRKSGVSVRFHPHQTNKKVDIASVTNPPPSNHPAKGRGQTEGPGTYRRFTRAAYPPSTVVGTSAVAAPQVSGATAEQASSSSRTPPGLYVRQGAQPPWRNELNTWSQSSSSWSQDSNDQQWNVWKGWGN
jgi:hypothetical protein